MPSLTAFGEFPAAVSISSLSIINPPITSTFWFILILPFNTFLILGVLFGVTEFFKMSTAVSQGPAGNNSFKVRPFCGEKKYYLWADF